MSIPIKSVFIRDDPLSPKQQVIFMKLSQCLEGCCRFIKHYFWFLPRELSGECDIRSVARIVDVERLVEVLDQLPLQ